MFTTAARLSGAALPRTATSGLTQSRAAIGSVRYQPLLVVRATSETEAKTPTPPPPAPKFCYGLPGSSAPMGEFDPLGFLQGKDEMTVRRYREAEVTHGRVSMLASLGFLVGENFNPLFDSKITGPAINHFQQVPGIFWTSIVFSIAMAEGWRLTYGWSNPIGENKANDASEVQSDLFSFKAGYYPGDIGFDPLGLKPKEKAAFDAMQTKELNNGRLAMIGIAGLVGQELATGTKAF